MGIDDLLASQLFFRRASYKVWQLYRINKSELKMLFCFIGAMSIKGQRTLTLSQVQRMVTGNKREYNNMKGPFYGLTTKGCLRKVLYNGRETFALTQMSINICQSYYEELARLRVNEHEYQTRQRPTEPVELSFQVLTSTFDMLGVGYKAA